MSDQGMEISLEPCDTCETGIAKMVCFDGKRRCRTCILRFSESQGWLDANEGPSEGTLIQDEHATEPTKDS